MHASVEAARGLVKSSVRIRRVREQQWSATLIKVTYFN